MFDPMKKHPMPTRDPKVRARDFLPVELGYDEETAVEEAKRCLKCKNKPCATGCPVQIDIPAFIAKVAERDFDGAYEIIARSSSLPAVCGRVCPQETPLERVARNEVRARGMLSPPLCFRNDLRLCRDR